jgi:hypothetical protein
MTFIVKIRQMIEPLLQVETDMSIMTSFSASLQQETQIRAEVT